MKRLFIAVPIRESSRKEIVKGILSNEGLKRLPVRWTAEQNLHLTLQFLGDVEEKRIPLLKQVMERVCSEPEPEALRFSSIGAFPSPDSPRILWIGFQKNNYLQKVQRSLTFGLIDNGFSADRKKYIPHLTLGRVRENSAFPAGAFTDLENTAAAVRISDSPLDRIVLFESILRPGGPVYTAVYEKKLV